MKNKSLWFIVSALALGTLAGCSEGILTATGEVIPPSTENIQVVETASPSVAETQIDQTETILSTATPLPPTQVPEEEIVKKDTPLTPFDPALDPLVQEAKEDLAQRLDIDEDQIILIEAKAVVWPDASMGCPHPDMRYKQVPYDGALIILRVGDIEYEYHSGGSRGLFLCEKSIKIKKDGPGIDLVIPPPARSEDE